MKQKIMMLALITICMMGFSCISFAANSNTFTFTNSGITVLEASGSGYKIEGTELTINESGTYTVTGSCTEGSIKVKKETTGVTLILKDLSLTSSTTAPISLNKSTKTTIEVVGTVTLTDKEDISTEDTNEDFEGACIKVKSGSVLNLKGTGMLNTDGASCKNGIKGAATSQITIDGSITFNIKAANSGLAADGSMILNSGTFNVEAEDAIKCDPDDDDTESLGDLTINGGTYTVKATDDGIRANGKLEINNGTFDITASEGLEATYLVINGGTFVINASDDAINASNKSTRYSMKVEINDGDITIKMGQGDTDAIDSNGDLIMNGGTLNITAQSAFDYDGKAEFNGGTLIVNGQQVNSFSNQFIGGGNFGRMDGNRPNRQNGEKFIPHELPVVNIDNLIPPINLSGEKGRLNASEWAIEELRKAEKNGLIPASLANNNLTENITRKEFAHIIVKLYETLTKSKVTAVIQNPFTDTNDSEVLKAYQLGITNGTSDTSYTPDSLITREEMATMFERAIAKAGIDTSVDISTEAKFSDDSEMHNWGKNAIYFMAREGIIKGVGNGLFDVNGKSTKEQAILLSERTAEIFAK